MTFLNVFTGFTTEFNGTSGDFTVVLGYHATDVCTDFDHAEGQDSFGGTAQVVMQAFARIFMPGSSFVTQSFDPNSFAVALTVTDATVNFTSHGSCALTGSLAGFPPFNSVTAFTNPLTSLDATVWMFSMGLDGTTGATGFMGGEFTFYNTTSVTASGTGATFDIGRSVVCAGNP